MTWLENIIDQRFKLPTVQREFFDYCKKDIRSFKELQKANVLKDVLKLPEKRQYVILNLIGGAVNQKQTLAYIKNLK